MGTSSLTTALDFLILGSFPSRLIEGIFSPNNFRMLEQYVEMSSPYIPLLIIKSIKILYPEYKGPLPPSETVEEWKKSVLKIPKTYPLRGALQSGIGGDKYVMTGIFSEGFHIGEFKKELLFQKDEMNRKILLRVRSLHCFSKRWLSRITRCDRASFIRGSSSSNWQQHVQDLLIWNFFRFINFTFCISA